VTPPRMFGEADLTKALEDGGKNVSRKVTAYLIGGCAMTFMGRKVATKDIDIVLGSSDDAKEFTIALGRSGSPVFDTLRAPTLEWAHSTSWKTRRA